MLLYVNKINKGEPDTASAFLYEGPHLFPSSLSGGLALGCLTCLMFSWCASDLNSDCQAQLAPGRSLETKGVQGICPKSPGSLDTAAREGSAKKIKQVFRAKSAVLPKACSSRVRTRSQLQGLPPIPFGEETVPHIRDFFLHFLCAVPSPSTQKLRFIWEFPAPDLPRAQEQPRSPCAPSRVLSSFWPCCFVNTNFSSCFCTALQTTVALAGKKTLLVHLSRNTLALHTCWYG